ncbi:MAG: tetratricopeptide repeat protein [Muribaculaceae bacterium]|nr:tetratricopeptide repeat protein [Muribaculaceae bacterium]
MIFNRRPSVIALLVALIAASLLVSSCSTRKNTAATRRYQAFITRYNIYYNGDTHFNQTLHDMETNYEDDYSQLVPMHPAEARGNSSMPQPSGDFTRSIEKGQKAIQLRSIKKRPAKKGGRLTPEQKAWYKRDEYNPFLHNAWMMMARSQYFNGDFAGAASTFFYVSRHFTWLPATVTEADLWQARCYVAMGWLFEAEVILNRIKEDELTDKTLKGLYAFVMADFNIKSGKLEEAVPFLLTAVKDASGAQKTRLRFLLGQIYARLGNNAEAYRWYQAAGSSPSAPYRTKFNARIKQSEVYSGADIRPEVNALKRMLRYDRNKDYRDQIYYAIGNLYLSRGDTTHAIENYVLAAENSTRNGIDKAINQITLGNLYFQRRQYDLAQPCYAEAVPQLPKDFPDYSTLKRRSDVLDELAVYSQNVTLQDSLLRLAAMTPEQRMEVINRLIDELKKREQEEAEAARREEYLANQAAQGQQMGQGAAGNPNSFVINTDNSWYFYNTATKNAGKTEFQRRWGARKLEDNWRRRNKSQFNVDDFDSAAETDAEENDTPEEPLDSAAQARAEELERASDPHYPEYYLAQIPTTEEQKATAHEIIQEGLYNMGIILKDKLEDYPAARAEFDRLLKDYPDNVYRLDVYYNLYLMYMRENKTAEAEHYRKLIISDFADSPLGQALTNPAYLDNLRNMDKDVQRLYEDTYNAYLDNNNLAVHKAYETMTEKYPLSKTMPKFMFLHALAYVTEDKPDEFNAVLRDLLERYPDTDITPVASAWLKGMAQGRQLHKGAGNMRGMIWDMRLTGDSTAVAEGAAAFTLDPAAKQLLVMTFATDEVSSNALLYEIARHNFKSFVVKSYDLEQLNFGRLGMIIIRDFDGMDELNHYRSVMAASDDFHLPQGVRPIVISDDNFKILLSQGRSFDEYFNYLQEQNYIDTQAGLLVPDQIETLEEADESAAFEPVDEEPADIVPSESEPAEKVVIDEVIVEEQPTPVAPAPVQTTEPAPVQAQPAAPAQATVPAPSATPAPAPTPAAPVIVPIPQRPSVPAYDPGSEGDDPLFD